MQQPQNITDFDQENVTLFGTFWGITGDQESPGV